nr:DUF2218 domain-containing protein [Aureimonas sp. N4]
MCKHSAHKFEIEFTPSYGEAALQSGTVVLDATDEALEIRIHSLEDTVLDQLEGVVAEHILRFAFREELRFDWRRGSPA